MTCDISIVIPLYNTAAIMENNVRALLTYLETSKRSYEILLRDDGSQDNTKAILKRFSHLYPVITCFFNLTNEGLGSTLRKLFDAAKGQYIVYLDCDLPFGVEVLARLLEEVTRYDIVVASRYHTKNSVQPLRRLLSRLYYLICRLLFDVPVKDIGSGTVVLRNNALRRLKLTACGFDIHIEMFVQAERQQLRIQEVPANFSPTQGGSFSILRHGPAVVQDTWNFYQKVRSNHRQV